MRFLFLLLCTNFGGIALSAEAPPVVEGRELPRFPPMEPETARGSFVVKRGFHMELVAAEPLIASPVAACFDERGRLFVVEMRDYSEQRDLQPHLGRVRLLEDRDNDGRCEHAAIFADDLPWPTALIWARGGLFVCAAPSILRFEDTDGDGHADRREVVYSGFNTGTPKMNVQALPNSLSWGPDNRIHLQTGGGNRGLIRSDKQPGRPPVELGGRDFWFDPRTYEFGFESGGGQFGMSYDDHGYRFACNNSDHLRTYLFDDRYGARNPYVDHPSPLVSIAADGPAAEVFRISPDEPWRVVRTRWRVAGKTPGPVEGGGRVSGYFTGATGTTVYRGDAFGPQFIGNTFTGDAGGNLVHRKQLREAGISMIGARPDDERTAEFIASRDTWFRPVSFANAPDGTLYVIDMYREVIEHPWSIPEQIKAHLDLTSGRDRGRIWRIAPDGFKSRPSPALDRASNEELAAALGHPNGWHRDTATRLLCERGDRAVVPELTKILTNSASRPARLHALRALDGMGALSQDVLARALCDIDPFIREHAVELCEQFSAAGEVPSQLWERLSSLAGDAAPRVRLQLAFTVGELKNDGALGLLARIAQRDADNSLISAAIRSAPPDRMAPLFRQLANDEKFAATGGGRDFLSQLAGALGARHEPSEIEDLFIFATKPLAGLGLLAALGEGLERSGQPFVTPARETGLRDAWSRARAILKARDTRDTERLAGVRLLAFDRSPESRDLLLEFLTAPGAEALDRAIFEALDRSVDNAAVIFLLEHWRELRPSLRTEATHFLSARSSRTAALLEAIGNGIVDRKDLSAADAARLRQNRDPKIAAAATKLFPPAPPIEERDAVMKRFEAALQLTGDRKKGHSIYLERCASCHRFRGEGQVFGPDLESVVSGGKAKILTHLIDPNREVAPQFAAYTAELIDDSTVAGVLANESSESVVIREPLGRETIVARARLKRLQTTGRSPMPEGLETGLAPEEMAGLLEFLTRSGGG